MRWLNKESIKAALELVDKYRSITLEDLEANPINEEDGEDIWESLSKITGFGYKDKCPICLSVNRECNECIYSFGRVLRYSWNYCCDNSTSEDIYDANSYEELLDAIKNRADYIEDLVNRIKSDNSGIVLQNNSSE